MPAAGVTTKQEFGRFRAVMLDPALNSDVGTSPNFTVGSDVRSNAMQWSGGALHTHVSVAMPNQHQQMLGNFAGPGRPRQNLQESAQTSIQLQQSLNIGGGGFPGSVSNPALRTLAVGDVYTSPSHAASPSKPKISVPKPSRYNFVAFSPQRVPVFWSAGTGLLERQKGTSLLDRD